VSLGVGIFASVVLILAVYHRGFRKILFWTTGVAVALALIGAGGYFGYTNWQTKRAAKKEQSAGYYVRAQQNGNYIIEHDGRQLMVKCRESLSWLDGLDKLGGTMTQHDCTYIAVGQSMPSKLVSQQETEVRYTPWVGEKTVETADVMDIVAEGPIGAQIHAPVHKTGPEILKALDWMQNTLADGDGDTYYTTKGGQGETRANLLPDIDGCDVTFSYATRTDSKETYHARQSVDLGAFDPTSLSVAAATKDVIGPTSMVTVYTTDKVPAVRQETGDRSWNGALILSSTSILWELPSPYANRFIKALHQAIVFCGGKPSSF
jgi:hypothetical protein